MVLIISGVSSLSPCERSSKSSPSTFSGVEMPAVAVRPSDLEKWFGAEDIARTYAVREVSFEAYNGEMLYITGPFGERQNHPFEHDLRNPAAQCRHGRCGRQGNLEAQPNELADFRLQYGGLRISGLPPFPQADHGGKRGHSPHPQTAGLGPIPAGGHEFLEWWGIKDRAMSRPSNSAAANSSAWQ